MKVLTLYAPVSNEGTLLDLLRVQPEVSGFTLTRAEGHSASAHGAQMEAAVDRVVGHVPRLRIELFLEDEGVASVLQCLRQGAGAGLSSISWTVTAIEEQGRF